MRPTWLPGDIDYGTGTADDPLNTPASPTPLSKMGPVIPPVWGGARVSGTVVYMANVADAEVWTSKYGKGQGQVADVVIAICLAPAYSVSKIYRGTESFTAGTWSQLLSTDGLGSIEIITAAVDPNPSWYSATGDAAGMKHEGVVYLRAKRLKLENGRVPQLSFYVLGRGGGSVRVDPADVAKDIYSDPIVGCGMPVSGIDVDTGSDGSVYGQEGGDASFRTYAKASGLWVARAVTERIEGAELLKSLCDCCNAVPVPTTKEDGSVVLRIVPRGDQRIEKNGVIYAPPNTAYTIDANDLKGEVTTDQVEDDDVYDLYPVVIRNEQAGYEDAVYAWPDVADACDGYPRRAPEYRAEWLTHPDQALALSRLMTLAANQIRTAFTFPVGAHLTALEQMDLLSLSETAGFGISGQAVRIDKVKDNSDGTREITAYQWPAGVAHVIDLTAAHHDGYDTPLPGPNDPVYPDDASPGDCLAPLIAMLPYLAGRDSCHVVIATGGGDAWGGAEVYVSADGGTTYSWAGQVTKPATYGTLAADLAASATQLDETNTLSVTLTSGALDPQSAEDRDGLVRPLLIVGEG